MKQKTKSDQKLKDDQGSKLEEGVQNLEFASRWDRELKEEESKVISGANQARFLAEAMQRIDSERSLFELPLQATTPFARGRNDLVAWGRYQNYVDVDSLALAAR